MKRDQSDTALSAFIGKHSDGAVGAITPARRSNDDPLVHELVVSCLAWNAPRAGVAAALSRIHETLVDYNELRVAIPKETAGLLGARYPAAEQRCLRLRSSLNEIFQRENGLTLSYLRDENKRTVKSYFESLPGLPTYAVSRVSLLMCEVHTFPIDSVIRSLFESAGVIESKCDEPHLAGRLERLIRAGDAAACFAGLEIAALKPITAKKPARPASSKKKPTTKKTAKKAGRKTA